MPIAPGYRFYSYGDACLLFRAPEAPSMTGVSPSRSMRATDGRPARGADRTPRGAIRTPAFMPVGTAGTVKAMYHRPGARRSAPTSSSATPIT